MADLQTLRLNKERHIRYWLRCLKTYLPIQYTSTDANRVMLSYFILSALDLLDALDSNISDADRSEFIEWLYSCQIPEGGFRGFPGSNLGKRRRTENGYCDPANLAATYFALAALVILKDDLLRVKRQECLEWLVKLQRTDGSFGQTLGKDGEIEGGRDTRFSMCAVGIRRILGDAAKPIPVVDINIENLTRYTSKSQV